MLLRQKRVCRITYGILLLVALVAFGHQVTHAANSLSVRLTLDMQTLDPAHIGQASDHAIGHLIYNGLVKYRSGGLDIVPDLAESWDISEDGLTYTFYLRQGVQWHKGYGEFTADDVVYSLMRIKDPATASRFQHDLDMVASVEAVDRYTVRITLSEPFSSFLSAVLAFRPGWIVNERAIAKRGDNYAVDPIGTGPYMFESWVRGSEVNLVANPHYFTELGYDRVSMKVVQEDAVAELALMTGELDVAYLYEGESAIRMLANPGRNKRSAQFPGTRTQWMAFNLDRPAVSDVRVRQAMIHALNKPAIAEATYEGLAQVVGSLFNPLIPGYIDIDPFPYDPDRARELLAEAGYADGLQIKMLVMPSRGLPVMATIMQDQWRRVGIDVELIIRERSIYDQLTKGDDYDLIAENVSRADAFQFASFLYGPNIPFPNTHRYSGSDDLIEAANVETDEAKREAIWREFQTRAFVEDVVGFAMTNSEFVLVWDAGIEGVTFMYQDAYPIEEMRPAGAR